MSLWYVFQREIRQYLTTPVAYTIASALLVFTGISFMREVYLSAEATTPVNPAVIPIILSFTLIFFAPLMTMRLIAEEKREGTLELLMTSPVPETNIVLGKFLGAWGYYTLILMITFLYQIGLGTMTAQDWGHVMAAYIGIWLYGGATLSIGLVFSAITENQIVAAFLSVITLFLLWLGDQAGDFIVNIDVARVVRQLSLQGHFTTSFASGLFRAEDVAFFAGIIVVMLFIAIRAVENQRWRS